MFQVTRSVVVAAFGAGRSDGALLAVPVIPAAALVEAGAAAVQAVGAGVRWLRHCLASGLHGLANRVEAPAPVPVATAASYPVATVAPRPVAVPVEEPVILPLPEPMPSAAQVTTAAAPEYGPLVCREDYEEALRRWGSVRAAAKAVGMAESTFRGRCRKAGVQTPGRKAKR